MVSSRESLTGCGMPICSHTGLTDAAQQTLKPRMQQGARLTISASGRRLPETGLS